MIFLETRLKGAYVIEIEERTDERGFFARSWCRHEFETRGLDARLVQCNISYNRVAGTLRGLHYQAPPHGETKVVRCTRGAVFDVIVDLRPDSPTYRGYVGVRLSALDHRMIYIPEGFAHGFQTLEDDTEIFYQMSECFHPESARGMRWNDPAFNIDWPPAARRIISDRDATYSDFRAE